MVTSTWRRLAPKATVLALALAGLAITQGESAAQTSSCGNGGGPLCKEVRTCRPNGTDWDCGTTYAYYPIEIT